jgi:endonuclease/exonuclease/phosphatase (EEP) superfamily protein YafD
MNLRPTDARAFLRSRLHALTIGLALVVAASFVGRLHWLFDLTTHFRAQYFAAALFLAFGCAALRSYRWASAALTLALINLAFLVSLYVSPDEGAPPPADATRLKIVSLNVYAGSQAYGEVIAYLREAKPDFIVLTEFTPDWLAGIQPLAEEYPERHFEARTDAFGIALFSKRPLRDVRLEALE